MKIQNTKTTPIYSTLGSDPDLGELVELFVDEMPDRIQNLTNLLEQSDWEELRRSAHQLKGAAGSYGFDTISPIAAVVEDKIRANCPEDELHQAVEDLCEMCRAARAGAPE
ncbi:MAG: Hpt domain-containing protein [Pirellulales bacterium]|nr:Hpt domain-containing protein [Pirellulales bacterium]